MSGLPPVDEPSVAAREAECGEVLEIETTGHAGGTGS
jgi:hypothetical protein